MLPGGLPLRSTPSCDRPAVLGGDLEPSVTVPGIRGPTFLAVRPKKRSSWGLGTGTPKPSGSVVMLSNCDQRVSWRHLLKSLVAADSIVGRDERSPSMSDLYVTKRDLHWS